MIRFRAATDIYWDGIRVIAVTLNADGRISHVAEPVQFTMKAITPGDMIGAPTFEFTAADAKSLMTALWEAGVRPADFKNANGEINRMEAHLEDMRRLVFVTDAAPKKGSL
jgi:hypothetical protein